MKRHIAVATLVVLLTMSLSAQQQDKSKRPSPPGTATVTFADGKKVTIEYSRPFAKGREIFGGLVPYDQVWRTGANEATSLKTDTDLVIGDATVHAGSYTLYTIPSKGSWKLIINKQNGQWGTDYDQSQDLARVDMKVVPWEPVEQFTVSLDKTGAVSAKLNLDWEKTRASADVKEKK
ncbi:MAG TPA: DUF2911 domain-containing protein [Terriglobales bacterium]|jgi:hypothetical protein|nr:DUF2911 domain-containing protein [Terriglobales bacterium]